MCVGLYVCNSIRASVSGLPDPSCPVVSFNIKSSFTLQPGSGILDERVCLSVCLHAYLRKNFTIFSVLDAYVRGWVFLWRRTL